MDKIFNCEQWRIILATTLSPVFAYITPTVNFMYALIIMFAFNIWAGMRADGVSIIRTKNFCFSKFKNSLIELFLYISIINVIYLVISKCGDPETAKVIIKSITYVFMYAYTQNAFKNLIKAYPKIIALRIIYHVIRLEFTRMLPSYWQPIIERIQNNENKDKESDENSNIG